MRSLQVAEQIDHGFSCPSLEQNHTHHRDLQYAAISVCNVASSQVLPVCLCIQGHDGRLNRIPGGARIIRTFLIYIGSMRLNRRGSFPKVRLLDTEHMDANEECSAR